MQYGQRKLQRSMTEMRRSRIGRASVSRGPGRALRGTMTSRGDMVTQVWRPPSPNGYPAEILRVCNDLMGPGRLPATLGPAVQPPEPLVGAGTAQSQPQSSCSMRTGRKYVSGGVTVNGAPSAMRATYGW